MKVLVLTVLRNWDRIAFTAVGFLFFVFTFKFLLAEKLAEASATFGMAIFCLIFASLARFKRFKGLGFEAELWEDTKREAAELTEKMKGVLAIHTREAMLNRVKMNRFGGDRNEWREHWRLFEELTAEHSNLVTDASYFEAKHVMDTYFSFDLTRKFAASVRKEVSRGKQLATKQFEDELGVKAETIDQLALKSSEIAKATPNFDDLFEVAKNENVAESVLSRAGKAKEDYKRQFNITLEYDKDDLSKLAFLSKAFEKRPFAVTEDLLKLLDPKS